jgi:hypothetical protein
MLLKSEGKSGRKYGKIGELFSKKIREGHFAPD